MWPATALTPTVSSCSEEAAAELPEVGEEEEEWRGEEA
jgi:hypothetical protein